MHRRVEGKNERRCAERWLYEAPVYKEDKTGRYWADNEIKLDMRQPVHNTRKAVSRETPQRAVWAFFILAIYFLA